MNWNGQTLVGFENHGGRTYLGTARPLGKVLKGYGNNAEDRTEGAVYRNAYGTYLHGSLLPKNPHFADYLIELALQRKYGNLLLDDESGVNGKAHPSPISTSTSSMFVETKATAPSLQLAPLDDSLEWEAHATMLERLGLYNEAATVLATQHASRMQLIKNV